MWAVIASQQHTHNHSRWLVPDTSVVSLFSSVARVIPNELLVSAGRVSRSRFIVAASLPFLACLVVVSAVLPMDSQTI